MSGLQRKPEWIQINLFLFLLYSFSRVRASEASQEEKPMKFMKPCFNEDELLNFCTDPIEICHEERADEIKLVRLDGVKVGSLDGLFLKKMSRTRFNIANRPRPS